MTQRPSTHTIRAQLTIRDADDNELARAILVLIVKFTPGYRDDDTDPGEGDRVELHRASAESALSGRLLWDAAQAWLDAHHDEIAAQCRAEREPDPDRMRDEAIERERV